MWEIAWEEIKTNSGSYFNYMGSKNWDVAAIIWTGKKKPISRRFCVSQQNLRLIQCVVGSLSSGFLGVMHIYKSGVSIVLLW